MCGTYWGEATTGIWRGLEEQPAALNGTETEFTDV